MSDMSTTVTLGRAEFVDLLAAFNTEGIYKVTFAIDGGLKVKINEETWSPPMGTL